MSKIVLLLASRKFWAAFIGLGLLILKSFKPDFPIPEDQLTNMVYLLVAYILGVAIDDGLGLNKKAG
jgi:hypothetical protein